MAARLRKASFTRVVLLALLAGLLAIGTYVASRGVSTDRASERTERRAVVTARVEQRSLRKIVVGSASIQPADPVVIAVPTLPGGSLPVVTGLFVGKGDLVQPGTVVAAVADRPVIVLRGALPAFRTMSVGVEGPDVAQLQAALFELGFSADPEESGTYKRETARQVAMLYHALGYTSQPGTGPASVPLGEIVFVRNLPAIVVKRAVSLGSLAGSDGIMTLADPTPIVVGTIPSIDAQLVRPGQVATIRLDRGGTLRATVLQRVGPRPPAGAAPPPSVGSPPASAPEVVGGAARTIQLRPERAVSSELVGRQGQLTITTQRAPASSLVVPITAIFSGSGETWLWVLGRAGRQRVEVRPGVASGGDVVVAPVSGRLRAGQRVIVSSLNEG